MNKKVILVILTILLFSIFAYGYGIYTPLYNNYLDGYTFNELQNHPSLITTYKWNDDEWEVFSKNVYNYKFNNKGLIIELESKDINTDRIIIYNYKYKNNRITEVVKRYFNNNEKKPNTLYYLLIDYKNNEIIETYKNKNEITDIKKYTFDNLERLIDVNAINRKMKDNKFGFDFNWKIKYIDSTNFIEKITKQFSYSENLETMSFSYNNSNKVIIKEGNLLTSITYINDLISKVVLNTPYGEFDNIITNYNYDPSGKLISYENLCYYGNYLATQSYKYVLEYE